jgi:glycine dehydrogenase
VTAPAATVPSPLATDTFPRRHLGPDAADVSAMLAVCGASSLDELIDTTVPSAIRLRRAPKLPLPAGEHAALAELRAIAARNKVHRSFIGQGYHGTIVPGVIRRNILENPGWYTAYTPYQAEISQGRLEALLNFQTMVCDLTAMNIANASLLDEATAAAEAMTLCHAARANDAANRFFVSLRCHPQTISVLQTRAEPLGWELVVGDPAGASIDATYFGVLLQYPETDGSVRDNGGFVQQARDAGARIVVATDLLALTLLKPPGEWGADVVVGSSQRLGVPLGYGGPHAAFFAVRDEFKRLMPGRLIGVSRDAAGRPAMRLSLQTREQHIRRDRATSNICTAQVLLAVMASMYAVYHGPAGLVAIAERVHRLALALADGLRARGYATGALPFFDTVTVRCDAATVLRAAERERVCLRRIDAATVSIALDETVEESDIEMLLGLFPESGGSVRDGAPRVPATLLRSTAFLAHPVFNTHHSETEMLRYIRRLEAKDLSLTTSMIALGSCTMKLNASAEMLPVTWPEFSDIHPFAPADHAKGYARMFQQLEKWLAEITGFAAVSLQPNAGSQGEYAGLLAIRRYHRGRGEAGRDVCLIPVSAHGTNPASAVMAGMRVVTVACDSAGNVDVEDLRAKAAEHADRLSCLMITYPSTHGVFEEGVREMCAIVHAHGGQVYMDGANLNAQVGLTSPGTIGADVCHLNLHKTFCIPHGGGGPGVGPIGVAAHLVPFLPGHPLGGEGAVSAAPWGSASICVISWMYIRMMGAAGLTDATRIAILNANYIASRLAPAFPVLYRGGSGRVAHECILDFREWKTRAGIEVEDIAKRLIDYGFHAPTMSWPVAGTLMVEPTESESKAELDRFCDAMLAIHEELLAVEQGRLERVNNPLKRAPHPAVEVASDTWDRPYARELAAYPAPWLRESKYWPPVSRVDNVYGDRNLFCSCIAPAS